MTITAPAPTTAPTTRTTEPTVLDRPIVELHGVTHRYAAVTALADVDLEVRAGELLAVLGPNGAGKTTAISLMLGLRAPSEGRVSIFGRGAGDPANRVRIGAMLQESGVPNTLRVGELVDLFRSYYPVALPTAELLAFADLQDLATRPFGKLSGGQKQRVYFALALAGDPDLLFLDEPTAGMDIASRHRFWEGIRALAALGKTVLFTTHLLEEADALATRIVLIDRGRVVAQGSPTEIKSRTAGKRIRIRTSLDAQRIAAIAGVRAVDREGAYLVATADDAMPVLRELMALGDAVEELTVEEASLEAAFLGLTGDAASPTPR